VTKGEAGAVEELEDAALEPEKGLGEGLARSAGIPALRILGYRLRRGRLRQHSVAGQLDVAGPLAHPDRGDHAVDLA
jgi:hypothetical protein